MIESITREFIHGKKFESQWAELGLNDDDLKDFKEVKW